MKVVATFIIVLFPALAITQQQTASLSGTVVDPRGAAVAGALVRIVHPEKGTVAEMKTVADGSFNFANAEHGDFTLTISAEGFRQHSRNVRIRSSSVYVRVELSLPGVSAEITIQDDEPPLRPYQSSPDRSITRREIQRTLGTNFQDVLESTPGVQVRSRYGSDEVQLSFRGSALRNNYHSRGVNILVNGIPYGDADGMSDFESIELLAADRVEVQKGANAFEFGGNSAGGSLNVATQTGDTARPLEIRLQGGSFGAYKGYISSGGTRGRFGYFASASDSEFDGYREHSQQGRRRLFAKASFKYDSQTDVFADVMFANISEKLPGALNLSEFHADPRQADLNNVANDWGRFVNYLRTAVGVTRRFGSRHEVSGNASMQYRDLRHPIFQILDQDTRTFSAAIRYTYAGERNRLVAGFAPQITSNGERRFANIGGVQGDRTALFDTRAVNYGFYFQNQTNVTGKLTVAIGGRVDIAKRIYTDQIVPESNDRRIYKVFSPRIGATYALSDSLVIFGGLARSYEPPIISELASYGAPGFLPLDAQDTWQSEVGARESLLKRRLKFETAFFNSEIRDEIINRNVQPFPNAPFTIPSFRNAPRTRHTGVEVSADAILAEDLLGGQLTLQNAYTFSRFKFVRDVDHAGNYIPGAPRHYLHSELRFEHAKGLSIAPNISWSPTSYFVDSANTTTNPSYAVLSLRTAFNRRRYGVFLEFRNLTDRRYSGSVQVDSGTGRFYEPGAPRSVQGGIILRLGSR